MNKPEVILFDGYNLVSDRLIILDKLYIYVFKLTNGISNIPVITDGSSIHGDCTIILSKIFFQVWNLMNKPIIIPFNGHSLVVNSLGQILFKFFQFNFTG